MGLHSKLSTSSAPQWVFCPGSVQMQERFPEDEDSQSSLDGTAAHDFAKVALDYGDEGDTINMEMISRTNDFYHPAPPIEPIPVTDEIIHAVRTYVGAILSITSKSPDKGVKELLTEHRVAA